MYDLLEAMRNPFFMIYVSMILSFCVTSSAQIADVELEFPVYRLQQLELGGNTFGSKAFQVLYEAVSIDANILRRCTIASWRDLAGRDLDGILSNSVGALLILVPADVDALAPADKQLFASLEQQLSAAKTELAVYVTPSSAETASLMADVATTTGRAPTAFQQLVNGIASNTFMMSTVKTAPAAALKYNPHNVIGRLFSGERSNPTIAFFAHYDSHSAFPGASSGSDSNGSGVVALLELLAILRRFYENTATRPPYNLVFVWTAAGKLNYQGARTWIDHFQEKNSDAKLELAVCVDSVGSGPLVMHVSKQPGETSAAAQLLKRLRAAAAPNQSVEVVAKKISLNAPTFAWEHERFNMKRLPAVTLSSLSSPDESLRRSLLDTPKGRINKKQLNENIRVVAEAVLGYVLSLSEVASSDSRVSADSSMLASDAVDQNRVDFFLREFASSPRSVSDEETTKAVSANLAATVGSYAKVATSAVELQEVSVWGGAVNSLRAERVKPAVFELVIAAGVVAFLAVFTHAIQHSHKAVDGIVTAMRKL